MRPSLKGFLAATLCCPALPILGQEHGSAAATDLQEQVALDPHALAVLPIEIVTDHTRAPALAAEAYEAILSQVTAIEGLYVIGRESVLPYADVSQTPVEIARGLGVGSILESNISANTIGIWLYVDLIDALTGESHRSDSLLEQSPNVQIANSPFNLDTLMPDMASRVAEQVESTLFPAPKPQVDPEQMIAEAQAAVLDTSLSDSERLEALRELRSRDVDSAVLAAAMQLAMSADEPLVRARVWRELTGAAGPGLVQPLLHALANDPAENVRESAATILVGRFLDEPGVREALEYAAESETTEWLRKKIQLSIATDAEREQVLQATVLDVTKTEMERLVAFGQLLNPLVNENPETSTETLVAMVEMARSSDVPEMRTKVWSQLSRTGDPYLVQPLLDALANDSNELVRDAAAKGLAQFLAEPSVHQALEHATANDSSPLVREAANEVLESANR